MTATARPLFATFEAALAEFKEKGKVDDTRCERCACIIEVVRKTGSVLTVACSCGLYHDTLRGL